MLNLQQIEEGALIEWIRVHQPDVIVLAHHYRELPKFERVLRAHRLRMPADIGVIVITPLLDGAPSPGSMAAAASSANGRSSFSCPGFSTRISATPPTRASKWWR